MKSLTFLGGKTGTIAIKVKHKKDGSAVMSFHPIQFHAKTHQPLKAEDYKGKNAIFKFTFANSRAADPLMRMLDRMRTEMIFEEGQRTAYSDVRKQYNRNVEIMRNVLQDMRQEVDSAVASKPEVKVVDVAKEGFTDMPSDVLELLSDMVKKESEKRSAAKEAMFKKVEEPTAVV